MKGSQSDSVRVATWNIHACKGSDFRIDPQRTLAVIDSLDADLIALQEVPTRSQHPAFRALLNGDLGYHCLLETTLPDHPDGFGNALLSRLPVLETQRLDLSCPDREPRCAIDARIGVAGYGDLHVLATHLGLQARERHRQFDRLATRMERADAATLLMGDFNDWRARPETRLAARGLVTRSSASRRSFPAWLPLLRLDHIVVGPGLRVNEGHSGQPSHWRHASDHLPLVAEIAFTSQEGQADRSR
ncbi:MAG: endonuclease/exonuclease/phosphatase family protein [Rhodanobacteraceae bacterium]